MAPSETTYVAPTWSSEPAVNVPVFVVAFQAYVPKITVSDESRRIRPNDSHELGRMGSENVTEKTGRDAAMTAPGSGVRETTIGTVRSRTIDACAGAETLPRRSLTRTHSVRVTVGAVKGPDERRGIRVPGRATSIHRG